MKLHFLGANRQVTGSCYLLETADARILVDCGMFQEREYLDRNWAPFPFDTRRLNAVLLTHVHIDHCGLIPKLIREGVHRDMQIFTTHPSVALVDLMLSDSARIQEEDAAYKRKRHRKEGRRGPHPEEALFTQEDVRKTLRHFQGTDYDAPIQINDSVQVTFRDAGHILGSALIEIQVQESGATWRLVFSGDIGQKDKPLIHDPAVVEQADVLVMESTYGDRDHATGGDIGTQLADVINRTVDRGGNVVIPTFALERAQELMYYISQLVHDKVIPKLHVYLDSPMAVDATSIFQQFREWFDEETWERILANEPPLRFPGLRMVRTSAQSRQINEHKGPAIIMATSGMCTGGRIKHHLRHNIHRPESSIVFVGYQGRGTLGRQILAAAGKRGDAAEADGEGTKRKPETPTVRIHGRPYPVRAEVAQILGFSGHADRQALLEWTGNFRQPPAHTFLTHGDLEAAESLAELLREQRSWPVEIPEYRQTVELD